MRRRDNVSGNLFPDAVPPQPPLPSSTKPELHSARYWADELARADTPERKAECKAHMVASLRALEREEPLQ